MKKRFYYFLVFVFIFIGIFVFFKKENDYKVLIVDEIIEEKEEIEICVLNSDGLLEVISVFCEENIQKDEYITRLYCEYKNSLPLDYESPIDELVNIQTDFKNDTLLVKIDKIPSKTNLYSFLKALLWSYRQLGFNKLEAKIEGQIYKVDLNDSINSLYLSNNYTKKQNFYELTEKGYIPYTVFHEYDDLDLIFNLSNIYEYDYKILDDYIYIDIPSDEKEIILKQLEFNLEKIGYEKIVFKNLANNN